MRLIDADFLKEWVDEYLSVFKKYDKGTIKGFVDHAPTIEPKRGEWKSVKASIYPYGYDVECSVCGHRMGSSFGYKFCPMCGASMKGADDE